MPAAARAHPACALVTDVHLRNAVAGVRGLGRAGIPVLALSSRATGPGRWSRYARRPGLAPDVFDDPRAFARAVGSLAAQEGQATGRPVVVYPGREESVDALVGHADALGPAARLAYPAPAALAVLRDKRALEALAGDAGLAAPATLLAASAGELARTSELPAPCALKPAGPGGALPTTRLVETEAELRALAGALPPDEPLLVQERARGPLRAVALVVARDGTIAARIQQVARRTWPPDAGASSRAVTVAPDEALVARVAGMLHRAGYAGLAHLQFLEVAGRPALIDVNPRFYGSLPLALAAGVNLPAAWHAVALDAPVPAPADYRVGVTYRWLEAELMAAARGAARPALTPAPRPSVGAAWAGDDPVPGALLAAEALWARVAKRVPGVRELRR